MGHGPAQQPAIAEEISYLFLEMRKHLLEGGRRLVRIKDLVFSRCVAHDDYWRLCLASAPLLAGFHTGLFFGRSFYAIAAGDAGRPARLQFDGAGNCRRDRTVQAARVIRLRRDRHVGDGRVVCVVLDVIGGLVRRVGPEFP